MVPTITLSKLDVAYLAKCADLGFTYGIIICQDVNPESFQVVHLAKNCEEDVDLLEKPNANEPLQDIKAIEDINTQALVTQWISACRMCPGSLNVQGVFVTSDKKDIDDEQIYVAARKMLHDMHNLLVQGNHFCVSVDEGDSPIIFLAYSTFSKKAVCKAYMHNNSGGSLETMTCQYTDKSNEWHAFECYYNLDDIFPIYDDTQKINIEKQFQRAIHAIKRNLTACEIFIENTYMEDTVSVESFIKTNRKKSGGVGGSKENYRVTVLLPEKLANHNEHSIKVVRFKGTIRFSGIIFSRIWCSNKNTVGDVKRYMRNDILRSLSARVQVYCDGLTDPHVSNDVIFISEPPRRVFFNIFADADALVNSIQFCEYIFRGEAPTVAVAQAKQVLDLEICTENIVADLEGLPDDEIFSEVTLTNFQQKISTQPTANAGKYLTRSMYMLSISVSLLVLLLSVWLHFFLR